MKICEDFVNIEDKKDFDFDFDDDNRYYTINDKLDRVKLSGNKSVVIIDTNLLYVFNIFIQMQIESSQTNTTNTTNTNTTNKSYCCLWPQH